MYDYVPEYDRTVFFSLIVLVHFCRPSVGECHEVSWEDSSFRSLERFPDCAPRNRPGLASLRGKTLTAASAPQTVKASAGFMRSSGPVCFYLTLRYSFLISTLGAVLQHTFNTLVHQR